MFVVPSNMTVKLSDNYEIISKKPNYSSEEDYISEIKFFMIYFSILTGVLLWPIVMVVCLLGCTIGAFVSEARKIKNLS